MPHERDGKISFGDYTVDLGARVVEHCGEPVSLEPQVFDVLAVLIEHRDRVVTKIELLDRVWGDRFVSPATLTSRIRDLRRALGDSGRTQQVIKTAHARGFRFVAAVASMPNVDTRHDHVNAAGRSLTPLLGREGELNHVRARLDAARLVTVVGPGGVGKTHLVRHVAASLDAIVAELVDIRDADALRHAVLESIGGVQRPDVDTTESLVQMLDGRDTVLVLDNCEHVIGEVASLVGDLLRSCSGLRGCPNSCS